MSVALRDLQQSLQIWTKMERKPETPEVSESTAGGVHVVEVNTYPTAPDNSVRADVHFMLVGLTEGAPDKDEFIDAVRASFGTGEFGQEFNAEVLASGPSYITLGAILGSQDLALRFIGLCELLEVSKAITPALLGVEGDAANEMAGAGFIMLGPYQGWAE